jgi:hypothetical protein
MELVVYALVVYFAFWVLGQSRICARPRAWLRKVSPEWIVYPLGCPVCFGWWVGVGLTLLKWLVTGWVLIDLEALCAAPILMLVLDEALKALERANTPPIVMGGTLTSTGGGSTVLATSGAPLGASGLVPLKGAEVAVGDGVKIPESMRVCLNPPPPPWVGPIPDGWTMHYTSGMGEWGRGFTCAPLYGRRVRTTHFNGQTGTIIHGFRNGDDCSSTWGELMYRLRWDPGQTRDVCGDVPVKTCTFIDGPDTPFNPLDYEQTR